MASQLAKPLARGSKLNKLAPHERDVWALLLHFLVRVAQGEAPSFPNFRRLWLDLGFSHVLQDVPYSFSKCQYQQAWYCTALNCVAGGVSADQANAVLATQPSEDSAPASDTQEPQAEPGTDLEALLLSLDPEPSAPGAAPDQVELTHEELDHILTGDCTAPDMEAGPAAAQASQENESSVPGGAHADFAQDPSLPPRARPLTPSDLESLELAGLDARVAALYCLYCLHSVQPRRPRVKIYLSVEHQAALLELASQLPAGGRPEAVVILRRLLGSCAFVPGCSGVRGKLPPDRLPFVRRPGSQTSLPPGLENEEAHTLREVKYVLSSGMRGLGAQHLVPLYDQYQTALGRVWQSKAREGAPAPPQAIADLTLGRLLKEYTEAKHSEISLLLQSGPGALACRGAAAEPSQGKAARPREGGPGGSRAMAKARRTVWQAAGASHKGQAAFDPLPLPAAARRVMEREAARKLDVQRRATTWAQHLGRAGTPSGHISDDDMPSLPGLPEPLPTHTPSQSRGSGPVLQGASSSQSLEGTGEVQGFSDPVAGARQAGRGVQEPSEEAGRGSGKQGRPWSQAPRGKKVTWQPALPRQRGIARPRASSTLPAAPPHIAPAPAATEDDQLLAALGADADMLAALAAQALAEDEDSSDEAEGSD
ncbi:hypothetical protein ACKKBG_A24545 [Auxenochlorella protothecoides x Auxenochlorella symbiontica]